MNKNIRLYSDPSTMEPLFPAKTSSVLEELAIRIIEKSAGLSSSIHPVTRKAISDFLRPMNSYYSNLIEGHDTHPIDIANALKENYSTDIKKRNLQLEAHAHINTLKQIEDELATTGSPINPASSEFIKSIHRKFYDFIPDDFKQVKTKEGRILEVIPGEFRTSEVEIGHHKAPYSSSLNEMMNKFEGAYNPVGIKSKINRIISIAASHHRLAWIHPFLDGNGRVVRLFSDALFIHENLNASGLWSISRGLARHNSEYRKSLSKADLTRLNDFDGRGNLSDKMLNEFCEFFLTIALDQIEHMSKILDPENIYQRIERFADLMVVKNRFKPEGKEILTHVFLKGKISKKEAMKITNTSDKTLKKLTDILIQLELLESKKEGKSVMLYANYPIAYAPSLFPGLYPESKEIDLLGKI